MQPIDDFAATLLARAGLSALPEDAKVQLTMRIADQVQRRIGMLALEELDEQGAEAFQQLMTSDPPPSADAVQAFLRERIPDFEAKLRAAMEQLAESFIAGASVGGPTAAT